MVRVFSAIFNNISAISLLSFIGEGNRSTGRMPPIWSHWQTLSLNVVSSTPRLRGIRTHNVSGDSHWLHSKLYIQLSYNHNLSGPSQHRWCIMTITMNLSTSDCKRVTRSLVLYVCFVDRCLSFWPLRCLFFLDIRILITPLVSSNSSYMVFGQLS